jgi:hypothetical protein
MLSGKVDPAESQESLLVSVDSPVTKKDVNL